MKVAIATDHNGVNIKKEIIRFLNNHNIETIDLSEHNSAVDDYPLYAFEVGKVVSSKEADYGILLCGTGIGMSIAANKIKGIRCARVVNVNETVLAREHNMANVIALSENTPDYENIVKTFINTKESTEERHIRRVNKIMDIERS